VRKRRNCKRKKPASGRRPDFNFLHRIYNTVSQHPGIAPGTLAREVGISDPRYLKARLVTMETQGFLLSEDDDGCLYPHGIIGQNPNTRPLKN
jgi:hypothetical protein